MDDDWECSHEWSRTYPVHYNNGAYTAHVCKCLLCGVHGLYYKRQLTKFTWDRYYNSDLGRQVLEMDADSESK